MKPLIASERAGENVTLVAKWNPAIDTSDQLGSLEVRLDRRSRVRPALRVRTTYVLIACRLPRKDVTSFDRTVLPQ